MSLLYYPAGGAVSALTVVGLCEIAVASDVIDG